MTDTDTLILGRQEARHVRARRMMQIADRAMEIGDKLATARFLAQPDFRQPPSRWFAEIDRLNARAFHAYARARRFNSDAGAILTLGVNL